MLTIKRRHTAIKAITAGSVAFAIGLTGATAFIGDNFQAETPTFNKEQNTSEAATDPKPLKDASADKTQQGSGPDSAAASTQPASPGSTWAPAPASSMTTTQSSTPQTTAPSSSTSTVTSPTQTTDTTSGSTTDTSSDCTLDLCVDETLDPVNNLLP